MLGETLYSSVQIVLGTCIDTVGADKHARLRPLSRADIRLLTTVWLKRLAMRYDIGIIKLTITGKTAMRVVIDNVEMDHDDQHR